MRFGTTTITAPIIPMVPRKAKNVRSRAGSRSGQSGPTLGTPIPLCRCLMATLISSWWTAATIRSPDEVVGIMTRRHLGDKLIGVSMPCWKVLPFESPLFSSSPASTLNHARRGWRIYTFSRHRLFDALKKHQAAQTRCICRAISTVPRLGASTNPNAWERPGRGHFLRGGQHAGQTRALRISGIATERNSLIGSVSYMNDGTISQTRLGSSRN